MLNTHKSHGFTLIELIFVIMIGGIIMSVTFNMISNALKNSIDSKNNSRFESIQQEINRFLENNGRFPCPASLSEPNGTASFGREILDDCSDSTNVAGTFRVDGQNGRKIRIGAVPVRSLNLPDDFIADAYSTRFVYAVTEDMAVSDNFSADIGAITIQDKNGNSITSPTGNVPYILLSHGENQWGGYSNLTGEFIGENCSANPSNLEKENCDHNNDVFISSSPIDEKSNYYDDKIIYYSKNLHMAKSALPAGAIMIFSSEKCPSGWSTFYGTKPLIDDTILCKKITP